MAISREAQDTADFFISANMKASWDDTEQFVRGLADRKVAMESGDYSAPPEDITREFEVNEWAAEDARPSYTMTPRKVTAPNVEILYYHGGGFVGDVVPPHWALCATMAESVGCPVTMATYRTLPLADFDEILHGSYATYRALVDRVPGKSIVLMGESAGATLALAVAQLAMRDGLTMPKLLVLNSPFFEFTGKYSRDIEDSLNDILLSWRACDNIFKELAPNAVPGKFPVDPFYGPVEGLPPLYIICGSCEILEPAACEFAKKVNNSGGSARFESHEGMFHAFLLSEGVPERDEACAKIAEMVRGISGA